MNKDVAEYKVEQLIKCAGYKTRTDFDELDNDSVYHDSKKDRQIRVRVPGLMKSEIADKTN